MGKNIINIALFGLGRIGQMHANNLINHKDFNLKYIFDKDQKLTKKLSKKSNNNLIIQYVAIIGIRANSPAKILLLIVCHI